MHYLVDKETFELMLDLIKRHYPKYHRTLLESKDITLMVEEKDMDIDPNALQYPIKMFEKNCAKV